MVKSADVKLSLTDNSKWEKGRQLIHDIEDGEEGLYSLLFARCSPNKPNKVSFKITAKFYNPGENGRDYLSAGDIPLPSIYFNFTLVFFGCLVVWIWVLKKKFGSVHAIHYLMLLLLVLKVLCLMVESIRFHFLSEYGSHGIWSLLYYVLSTLKGIMLFTVIMLIGSGWSMMKSFLNEKEKKIILVVLTLQVFDNIALIVLEESGPGTRSWVTWRDLLHVLDILCCCAILFPIVWSIRALKTAVAAHAEGPRADLTLNRLKQFRTFYIMVVVYIYFTRIVVFLIQSTSSFSFSWFSVFVTEAVTLVFYLCVGWKFRPSPDNPYLSLSSTADTKETNSETGISMEAGAKLLGDAP